MYNNREVPAVRNKLKKVTIYLWDIKQYFKCSTPRSDWAPLPLFFQAFLLTREKKNDSNHHPNNCREMFGGKYCKNKKYPKTRHKICNSCFAFLLFSRRVSAVRLFFYNLTLIYNLFDSRVYTIVVAAAAAGSESAS